MPAHTGLAGSTSHPDVAELTRKPTLRRRLSPGPAVNSVQLGAVNVTRLIEWTGPVLTVDEFFPDVDQQTWVDNQSWLAPDFWRPADNAFPVTLQSWLLRSADQNILIDTGGGNGKPRPSNPAFDHLDNPYLEQLAAAGLAPADINLVVNTHLHIDHVGWNTVWHDGGWVPTFPNARYLFPKDDLAYFDAPGTDPVRRLHIDDSVVPVLHAGQADLFDGTYRIDEHLTMQSAPGHTPGSSVVMLNSGTSRAAFVGDVLHSPVQIIEHDHNSCFCLDPAAARESRRRVLRWAADNDALVLPAHLGGSGAAQITRRGDNFQIRGWAPFPPAIAI